MPCPVGPKTSAVTRAEPVPSSGAAPQSPAVLGLSLPQLLCPARTRARHMPRPSTQSVLGADLCLDSSWSPRPPSGHKASLLPGQAHVTKTSPVCALPGTPPCSQSVRDPVGFGRAKCLQQRAVFPRSRRRSAPVRAVQTAACSAGPGLRSPGAGGTVRRRAGDKRGVCSQTHGPGPSSRRVSAHVRPKATRPACGPQRMTSGHSLREGPGSPCARRHGAEVGRPRTAQHTVVSTAWGHSLKSVPELRVQ